MPGGEPMESAMRRMAESTVEKAKEVTSSLGSGDLKESTEGALIPVGQINVDAPQEYRPLAEPAGYRRDLIEMTDLSRNPTGLLWYINRVAFHPHGMALTFDIEKCKMCDGSGTVTQDVGYIVPEPIGCDHCMGQGSFIRGFYVNVLDPEESPYTFKSEDDDRGFAAFRKYIEECKTGPVTSLLKSEDPEVLFITNFCVTEKMVREARSGSWMAVLKPLADAEKVEIVEVVKSMSNGPGPSMSGARSWTVVCKVRSKEVLAE